MDGFWFVVGTLILVGGPVAWWLFTHIPDITYPWEEKK